MDPEKRRRQRTSAAILKEHEVARIKWNLLNGLSVRDCAEAYGVAAETIRRISRGETWGWVRAQKDKIPEPDDPKVKQSLDILSRLTGDIQRKKELEMGVEKDIEKLEKGD